LATIFHALDLRLSREFEFKERWRLILIGEAFNLYNAANLSCFSGNLTNGAFGQLPAGQYVRLRRPQGFSIGSTV
jgi:hypothetical protein